MILSGTVELFIIYMFFFSESQECFLKIDLFYAY